MKSTRTCTRIALALAVALPCIAQAHKAWILPSATVLSSNDWITADAAVSNDLFYFNHVPLRSENLLIHTPDGGTAQPQNLHTGRLRSVFDLQLEQSGTYRLAIVQSGLFASWSENGEQKRWRGNAARFEQEVPKDAKDLKVTQNAGRIETYVTAGSPTQTVFKPTGTGLELAPVTHPNDVYAGEAATFKLLFDGKPAAGLEVEVVRGSTRYRDHQEEIKLSTDAEGAFTVTWPEAGMYWLETTAQDDKATVPPATQRRASYVLTVEVLPQ